MKKYQKWLLVGILVVLLFPYGQWYIKDGGSKEYKAILYTVTKVHRLSEEHGYLNGWKATVLGFEILNTVK